jgi:hypothetical protein
MGLSATFATSGNTTAGLAVIPFLFIFYGTSPLARRLPASSNCGRLQVSTTSLSTLCPILTLPKSFHSHSVLKAWRCLSACKTWTLPFVATRLSAESRRKYSGNTTQSSSASCSATSSSPSCSIERPRGSHSKSRLSYTTSTRRLLASESLACSKKKMSKGRSNMSNWRKPASRVRLEYCMAPV